MELTTPNEYHYPPNPYVPTKSSSIIWDFARLSKHHDCKDKIFCLLCGKSLKYNHSPSNMEGHLRNHHWAVFSKKLKEKEKQKEETQQATATTANRISGYFGAQPKSEKQIVEYLVDWISSDMLPTLVASEKCEAFVKSLNPKFKVPCQKTMSKHIQDKYIKLQLEVCTNSCEHFLHFCMIIINFIKTSNVCFHFIQPDKERLTQKWRSRGTFHYRLMVLCLQ